jgi:hypothetical protein
MLLLSLFLPNELMLASYNSFLMATSCRVCLLRPLRLPAAQPKQLHTIPNDNQSHKLQATYILQQKQSPSG